MEIKNYPWYPNTLNPSAGIKMGNGVSKDRDSNQGGDGYDPDSKEEQNNPYLHRDLTDEEFEEAIKKLTNLKGYKEANLSHKVEKSTQGKRVVLILDPQQNIIRRLKEADLGTAFLLDIKEDKQKGKLIDKEI